MDSFHTSDTLSAYCSFPAFLQRHVFPSRQAFVVATELTHISLGFGLQVLASYLMFIKVRRKERLKQEA